MSHLYIEKKTVSRLAFTEEKKQNEAAILSSLGGGRMFFHLSFCLEI